MSKSELIKDISGHSGCKVVLIKQDEKLLVQKTASDRNYNSRLKKQLKKQKMFTVRKKVKTPKIYEAGINNNLFYFNMEFINGRTLAEYAEKVSKSEISEYINCLFESLYYRTEKKSNSGNIFGNKIKSLEKQCEKYYHLKEVFEILKSYDWTKVYKSPCHGDLTLENILITNNKELYLIDFLDSFYNSWMIDIAKLLQDLEIKWSFRYEKPSVNRDLNLLTAKETLLNAILRTKNGKESIETIYHLLLLNLIRIYPYIQDDYTYKFLNSAVKKLKESLIVHKEGVCV